jgi:hypothetical protein
MSIHMYSVKSTKRDTKSRRMDHLKFTSLMKKVCLVLTCTTLTTQQHNHASQKTHANTTQQRMLLKIHSGKVRKLIRWYMKEARNDENIEQDWPTLYVRFVLLNISQYLHIRLKRWRILLLRGVKEGGRFRCLTSVYIALGQRVMYDFSLEFWFKNTPLFYIGLYDEVKYE